MVSHGPLRDKISQFQKVFEKVAVSEKVSKNLKKFQKNFHFQKIIVRSLCIYNNYLLVPFYIEMHHSISPCQIVYQEMPIGMESIG